MGTTRLNPRFGDDNGVSPVIAVILMVAITIVLAGVVFVWASAFTNEAEGEPRFFNVDVELTTTSGNHPEQLLKVDIISGTIDWSVYRVNLDGIDLNRSNNIDKAGSSEVFNVPNGDFPSGGSSLIVGNQYLLKIISIDYVSVVFNDEIICKYP